MRPSNVGSTILAARRNVDVVLSYTISQLGAWVLTPELLGTVRVVRALFSHCGIPERPGYAG